MHPAERPLLPRLRVFRLQAPVWSLGPGRRIGLWVQGCARRCPGCVSPASWPAAGGRDVDVRQLAEAIAEPCSSYDGLTISGGEPFDQYPALMALCAYLKALRKIHIQAYTGYRLDELLARHPDRAFLRFLDALVDGPYLRDEHDDAGWRGSRNQRRYRLFGGYAELEEDSSAIAAGPWSLSVTGGGQIFMAGIPAAGELERLGQKLATHGLATRFA